MPHQSTLFFTTADHVSIVGTYMLPDDDSIAGAVLLHMMPSNRQSYHDTQLLLAHCGIASFAIDLRGHGDSVQQEKTTLDYKTFSDADHQKSILDVAGAVEYLCTLAHIDMSRVSLIGASVGANLALEYQQQHPEISLSILLSPGISYHGIHADEPIRKLKWNQQSILFTSTGDEYSFESSLALHELAADQTIVEEVDGNEHGTALFLYSDVVKKIIKYMKEWSQKK